MFRQFKKKKKKLLQLKLKSALKIEQISVEIHGHRGPGFFFDKKLILDYYFCLTSGPVFLFQIFIIAPLPLPRDIKLYHCKKMHVKEIYVIFIHLFDSGILLIIDLSKEKARILQLNKCYVSTV
jgi:hypothetical protein